MGSRYDYKCEEHGCIEVVHSMKEDRRSVPCPHCSIIMKPLISRDVGMKLTGRPAWAYNDIINAAKANNGNINENTVITDDREGSKGRGSKMKMNNSMGNYNAQW
jgi:predicted nucleic acid-binding Zn ribbon protein